MPRDQDGRRFALWVREEEVEPGWIEGRSGERAEPEQRLAERDCQVGRLRGGSRAGRAWLIDDRLWKEASLARRLVLRCLSCHRVRRPLRWMLSDHRYLERLKCSECGGRFELRYGAAVISSQPDGRRQWMHAMEMKPRRPELRYPGESGAFDWARGKPWWWRGPLSVPFGHYESCAEPREERIRGAPASVLMDREIRRAEKEAARRRGRSGSSARRSADLAGSSIG